jgi:uncharacterized protein
MLITVSLTCVCITFLEVVAATKVLNLFSSLVTIAVFAVHGLIDWKLGLVIGLASFVGAAAGAVIARRLDNPLLRRVSSRPSSPWRPRRCFST